MLLLGLIFVVLKGYEWHLDFEDHDWIGDPEFPVTGSLEGGAKLFWSFYWVGTVLHAAHMTVAMGLVTYIVFRARRRAFSATYHTPVEVVGIVLELCRYRLDGALAVHLPYREGAVRRQLVVLGLTWCLLMAIAGGEFLVAGMHMRMENRPVILFFSATMVVIVAFMFMHLNRAPTVAKGFAAMGVFWLILVLGLGSMDMLTRSWYPVAHYNPY